MTTIATPARGFINLPSGLVWLYASCANQIVAYYCVTHDRCPLHGYETAAKREREPGEENGQ